MFNEDLSITYASLQILLQISKKTKEIYFSSDEIIAFYQSKDSGISIIAMQVMYEILTYDTAYNTIDQAILQHFQNPKSLKTLFDLLENSQYKVSSLSSKNWSNPLTGPTTGLPTTPSSI